MGLWDRMPGGQRARRTAAEPDGAEGPGVVCVCWKAGGSGEEQGSKDMSGGGVFPRRLKAPVPEARPASPAV